MAVPTDPRLAAVMQAIRAELTIQAVYTVARLDVATLARSVLRAIDVAKPEPAHGRHKGGSVYPAPALSSLATVGEKPRESWIELGRGVVHAAFGAGPVRVPYTGPTLEVAHTAEHTVQITKDASAAYDAITVVVHDPLDPARQKKARLLDQPTGREPFRPSRKPVRVDRYLAPSNTRSLTLVRDDDPRVLATVGIAVAKDFKVGEVVRVFVEGEWGEWRVRSIDHDTDSTRDIVLGPVG